MTRRWLITLALAWACRSWAGEAGFEQRIGQSLPLDARFADTSGASHALGEFFQARPVVLTFGYARCPQLCAVVADGAAAALRQIRPVPGRDFEVVMISIDPAETAAEAAAHARDVLHRYGEPKTAGGWHYLRGSEAAIAAVTQAAGFHYAYDPRSRQYAHPSGLMVLTPTGAISRYFLGVEFPPSDVAAAIRRAARGEQGERTVDLLLRCFRGDSIGGRYGAIIWRALAVAVTLTVVALAAAIGWMLRAERRLARNR